MLLAMMLKTSEGVGQVLQVILLVSLRPFEQYSQFLL